MNKSFIWFWLFLLLSAKAYSFEPESKKEKPPITPAWAFTPWVWEDSINTQDAALRLIQLYKKKKIPVGAIIIDSPWSTGYNNFKWDKERYPDPQAMIDEMHQNGVRVLMWLTGFLNSKSKDVPVQKIETYDYALKKGYVVDNGKESEWWKGKGIHVDFTNSEAVKWFQKQLDKIIDMHIDGFKIDDGCNALNPYLVLTSTGPMRGEQFGTYYYNSIASYGLKKNPEFVNMARGYSYQASASSGTGYLQTTFQGDFSGNWTGLKHQINNTYKTARLGYGAPGFEIGGFMDERSTKNEFIRYAQFGSFCPIMENGGSNGAFTNHLPWFHGEDALNIYRYFATLHAELVPYLFSASVEAHLTGNSIISGTSLIEESHLLGKWLFVKAISSENNRVSFHLPSKGKWIDYWTGIKYKGDSLLQDMEYPLEKYPIFIRSGAIIPMNVSNDITGHGSTESSGKQTVLIYPKGKTKYVFHKPTGSGVEYEDIKIRVDEGKRTIAIEANNEIDYIFLIGTADLEKVKKKNDILDLKSGQFIRILKKGKSFTVNF